MTTTERAPGWQASLEIGFARRGDRTALTRLRHRGPLRVQRPFHPQDDGTCHVYVLHPPGGFVGGDRLAIDVDVETTARALITTPAAGKVYRSEGATAHLVQRCRVADGASLEWLPQENILFGGSRSRITTRIDLAGDARFLGWEITALGRPAAGDDFATGSSTQSFEIWRHGELVWIERGRYRGGSPALVEPWGLGGMAVTGTLVIADGDHAGAIVDAVRERLTAIHRGRHAVTALGELVVCRALAAEAEDARAMLTAAWAAARPIVLGHRAVPPRVWAT